MAAAARSRPLRLLVIAITMATACTPEQPAQNAAGPVPETIDVAPAPAPSIAGDVQAAPPRKGLVGILPGDFPRELPIYLPASVIDFGKEQGRRFVLLQSPDPRAAVEASLRRAAKQAGLELEGGQGGHYRLSKGERRYQLKVQGQNTTEFRYEY